MTRERIKKGEQSPTPRDLPRVPDAGPDQPHHSRPVGRCSEEPRTHPATEPAAHLLVPGGPRGKGGRRRNGRVLSISPQKTIFTQ